MPTLGRLTILRSLLPFTLNTTWNSTLPTEKLRVAIREEYSFLSSLRVSLNLYLFSIELADDRSKAWTAPSDLSVNSGVISHLRAQ